MKTDGVLQVCSQYAVSRDMAFRIPKEKLDAIIKRELSRHMATYILSLLETEPIQDIVNYKVKQERDFDAEKHTIRLNLISDTELRRLKKIEELYQKIACLSGMY